jgi:hypothetical protein
MGREHPYRTPSGIRIRDPAAVHALDRLAYGIGAMFFFVKKYDTTFMKIALH